jgi:hypothetical protein
VQDRTAQPQVEAEYDSRGPHYLGDCLQIREGVQGLQANDHLTGSARKHLERTLRQMGARIHQQGTRKPGVELGQLTNQGALHCPTLDGIQVRHVALVDTKISVKCPQHGHRVTDFPRHQVRLERGVARALPGLGVNGNSASDIKYRNDLHRSRRSAGGA